MWKTSSFSHGNGDCVEVRIADAADVRDSKHTDSGYLSFPRLEWSAFLAAAVEGEL
ncbi:DUF397 domain-containing protein [Spiractinospora alimapuensis]|uniref:DUF397 domain-containing protein n=1 Tax=Spiractinospora alimapuensis TaxID=2820884 RepID=UPI001F2480A9|nr:DUF397 domain-containing protein [Spiractinospora alimapuensis]QVQ52719.1 DUF397 domain-containing protein [Spiractinospora alimapuensis]